ncbi:hypothetical protein CPB84DRAFT_1785271 [Gymnopilus junonius]|uniref:Uncharacterized protein n=1 Tax=Gymnopilus junonius TaxID=109634 RepID=A0A9P5NJY4_GYMJU|nr:hypothetical protein CPB84DRAFT_1785271 [Gymnopilus junonius]
MPHIVDEPFETPWKVQLRERVEKNLDSMLQDVHVAYKRKAVEAFLPYKQDIQNLRRMAEEELRAEIEREEQERNWAPWQTPEEADQSVIAEQLVILNQIRNSAGRVHHIVVEEHNGSLFQQGSSSRPSYGPHSPAHDDFGTSFVGSHTRFFSDPTSIDEKESPAEKEARLRAEKQAKQQEEFHKRAEAIQERKRRERQSTGWAETISSSSSNTSASDQESSSPVENSQAASAMITMTEEDIINLVIFHDQQWISISSLPHLRWSDFPWPVLSFSSPSRKEDLTIEAVVKYVLAPLTVNRDRAIVKDRLKDLIRRWHPDRFETKYLALIADLREREMVREGAGIVARILNDLLGRWNDV